MVIVKRTIDHKNLEKLKPPLLVYGRRKTGKTFLIKNYYKDSNYFFVRRDKSIYWENKKEVLTYNEFKKILDIMSDIVIVDEFHRLPKDFMDYLHMKSSENIILITSTLFLAKKLLEKRSPLLGLFLEYRVDPIDERDILMNLKKYFKGRELIEKSVFLREPLLLKWFDLDLFELINSLKITVPGLIGEIFIEEDRKLTKRYEGILRAISSGCQTLGKITSFLYSHGLIEEQNPSIVKPYLKNLLNMGLLKRYPEHNGKRFFYFVSSALMDIYFYLDEKYNFSEEDLDKKYLIEKLPFYVEDFFRTLFAKLYNHRIFMIERPNLEIDIALGDFKKLKLVAEVKWKNKVTKKEIKSIEEKLNKFHDDVEKLLIVPSKNVLEKEPKDLRVLDVEDIVDLVEKMTKD